MAGKRDFDNLMKVMKITTTLNGATVVSTEVDLELPRGFIARVRKIIHHLFTLGDELETLAADDGDSYVICVVNDPDDNTTTSIPANSVDHDVITEWPLSWGYSLTTSGVAFIPPVVPYQIDFPEELDIVVARNMRVNAVGLANASFNPVFNTHIYYTLEKVTDSDILMLLDIL